MLARSTRCARVLIAVVGATLAPALVACANGHASGYPDLHGARLEVVAAWSGPEQARFAAVLRGFTARTGAVVRYMPAHDRVPAYLDARLAAGDTPDVALLPQPGLLSRYARAGGLVPLAADTARVVRQEYSPEWQSLATVGGQLYGVWFKAANKSLLWYDLSAFERAGIAPPTDLDGLFTTAQAMRSLGIAPFSVGGADQWVLDDWFANLYLQIAGPARYDRLAAHRMPWTDPTVAATLRVMARLLTPANLRGGLVGALHLSFQDSVVEAFTNPPRAAMVYEGDFVAGMLAGHARIGVDVDAAPFPEATTRTVIGGGDVAVQMRRTPGAAALLRYLADPESAAIWARAGGFISPNQQLDLSDYPNPLTRLMARDLLEADDGFRFGLADLQPAAFGSTPGAGMQGALHDFLVSGDVAATQRRLEATATAAHAGPL